MLDEKTQEFFSLILRMSNNIRSIVSDALDGYATKEQAKKGIVEVITKIEELIKEQNN